MSYDNEDGTQVTGEGGFCGEITDGIDKTIAPWYQPELEKAGTHFFCHACLGHKPFDDRSPDERYCQSCHDFLLEEASLLSVSKRPAWIPRSRKIDDKKTIPVPQDTVLIMHTINAGEIPSVHNSPAARPITPSSKRGPKHRDLPEDLIRQWANDGMGAKSIASRLKREQVVVVHYSTVQRILAGKRN